MRALPNPFTPVLALALLGGCPGQDGGSGDVPATDTSEESAGDVGSGGKDSSAEEDLCEADAYEACHDGDVYSFDSCDEPNERLDACGSDEECVESGDTARCESTCEDDAETRCYGGDVYNYDSCDQRGDLEEACANDEECVDHGSYATCEQTCTSRAATTCYDGDVYYADSCGEVESRKESCDLGCVESGTAADCLSFNLDCERVDWDCVSDYLDVDIECTFDNWTAFPLTIDSVALSAESADSFAIDEWDDASWTSGATVAAGASYVLDDDFNADFDDTPSDQIVHLLADITFDFSGTSVTIVDWEDASVIILETYLNECDI